MATKAAHRTAARALQKMKTRSTSLCHRITASRVVVAGTTSYSQSCHDHCRCGRGDGCGCGCGQVQVLGRACRGRDRESSSIKLLNSSSLLLLLCGSVFSTVAGSRLLGQQIITISINIIDMIDITDITDTSISNCIVIRADPSHGAIGGDGGAPQAGCRQDGGRSCQLGGPQECLASR